MNSSDLHWLSGFMEGEGSFGYSRGHAIWMSASQNTKEPLEKVAKIVGHGKIHWYANKGNGIFIWRINPSILVAGWLMILYSLMSIRRKGQIRKALHAWKTNKHSMSRHSGSRSFTF